VLCHAVLCCAVPCCAVLCCAMLCCAVLCYGRSHSHTCGARRLCPSPPTGRRTRASSEPSGRTR
jgi:hypothetical protein